MKFSFSGSFKRRERLLKNVDSEVCDPVDPGDLSSYSDFGTHLRNGHLCPVS